MYQRLLFPRRSSLMLVLVPFAIIGMFTSLSFIREHVGKLKVPISPMGIAVKAVSSNAASLENANGSPQYSKQDKPVEKAFVKPEYAKDWSTVKQSSVKYTGEIVPKGTPLVQTVTLPYMIPNKDFCSKESNLTYVVVVHTAPDHFETRRSIRQTWANSTFSKGVKGRTVFLLGSVNDQNLQKSIQEESNKYRDIVQGSFQDSYINLTLKAVMGLRWLTENCRNAKFVIKADDDVFVNIPSILKYIFPILSANSKDIICHYNPNGTIFRRGKSGVGSRLFKGQKVYPMPFCFGITTFYRLTLAVELFEVAKTTPFYPLDDVYIYGILASKIKGLTWWRAMPGFYHKEEHTRDALARKLPIFSATVRSQNFMEEILEAVRRTS